MESWIKPVFCCARRNHLTLIDCTTAEHQLIPASDAMPSWSILLAFSGLQKSLIGTDYNRRVVECAGERRDLLEAAGRMEKHPLLGLVTAADYERFKKSPSTHAANHRAKHFFPKLIAVRKLWPGKTATFTSLAG